jgi:hypothetical protein
MFGGREGIRTLDLSVANAALCQLSYAPMIACEPVFKSFASIARALNVPDHEGQASAIPPGEPRRAISSYLMGHSSSANPRTMAFRTSSMIPSSRLRFTVGIGS